MKNKKEIKDLAKKIIDIELKLQDSYDSKLFNEINNLVKKLNIDELIELDEEINKKMSMPHPM